MTIVRKQVIGGQHIEQALSTEAHHEIADKSCTDDSDPIQKAGI